MSETPGNKYGTTPYAATTMPDFGSEPRSSRLTKMLIWPLLALNLVSSIITLMIDSEEFVADSLPPEQLEQLTPEVMDSMVTMFTVTNIVTAVITLVLFVIVGLGLRGNRMWARFVGLILAILFLLSSAYSLLLATDYGNLSGLQLATTILGWITVVLTVVWIVQAMSKSTSQWFAIHRRLQN